jgi:hypothetical protein
MSMRRKFIFIAGGGVIAAVLFVICVFSGLLTPNAPDSWRQIHAGMNRADVLKLVGPPPISSWPEKCAETWQIEGVFAHHNLFIYYGHSESVVSVWEGTWIRGYGWAFPRKETLDTTH